MRAGSDLDRCKAGEGAEDQAENFTALEPALAAEQKHPRESENGIGEGEPRDGSRHRRVRIDELDPGQSEQQKKRGPNAEGLGVGQAQAEFVSTSKTLMDCLDRLEDRPPRIDQRPYVGD